MASLILPGEKVTIKFTILVDKTSATALNLEKDKIEDIMVLSMSRGKDYFIVINGTFVKTCYGMPLDKLYEMKTPSTLSFINII
jgi:phosphatidylinositol-bisphosphatase